jgi:hypothetical protein
MSKFLKVLAFPMGIELINAIIYTVFIHKPEPTPLNYWSAFSLLLTGILLFWVGWRSASFFAENVMRKAAFCGVLLWLLPTLLAFGVTHYVGNAASGGSAGIHGALFSAVFLIPILLGVPMIGAWAQHKFQN